MVNRRLPSQPRPSPEQRELDRYWDRIWELREEVVEAERALVTDLQALDAFAHDVQLRCGRRYAELDAILADIAEIEAARDPGNAQKAEAARLARKKARQTIEDCRAREKEGPSKPRPDPTDEVKAAYRQAARRFHPDLAQDEAERRIRHDYMVQLNAAYRRADVDGIERLVTMWDASLGPAEEESASEQLVHAIRIADRLRARLAEIDAEREKADESSFARLFRDVLATDGECDPISELVEALDRKIEQARATLDSLRDA
ncbi:MAG: hypothetical protein ACYTG6_08660 [Planctomycetota bacterium]|jgi:hypothetical protein